MEDFLLSRVQNEIEALGITSIRALYHNLSYEDLFQHETDPSLTGLERAVVTNLGAVNVDTGRFTGRSPKDKYIVVEPSSQNHIWWAGPDAPGSDNHPLSPEAWDHLYEIAVRQLSGKRIYVQDGFACASESARLGVRVVTEVAWQAHFCKNMFIRPTQEELQNFRADWTILNACKAVCSDYAAWGLRSEVFIAFHFGKRMTLIGGTWYGGEMKKGIFTVLNYLLPLRGIASLHCSANMGAKGDTALFFGLSGTGKTTLSTDPERLLIGDDEHGWDDQGVFNFEGGCYAKCINLDPEKEPDIYQAIRRDALLENCVVRPDGSVDFSDASKTENTRVSYPLYHIKNIVKPVSRGNHANVIIFLAADAFGVMPPVAVLSPEEAMYQYLSGYTAKVAGTELGIREPVATFSTCYGAAFLPLHPTVYAEILGEKMRQHKSRAYLVSTGWIGGPYGVGQRINLRQTRNIIHCILNGSIEHAEMDVMPLFRFRIPRALPGVDRSLLNPRNTWSDPAEYDAQARKLAQMFAENFKRYANTEVGKHVAGFGPQV